MNYKINLVIMALVLSTSAIGQKAKKERDLSSGLFSVGTRNTFSFFNHDQQIGKGIGGQTRLQLNDKFNTEWFFDFITSKNAGYTLRNDYHFGWSIMYSPGKKTGFDMKFKPYALIGHCFDYSMVREQKNKANSADNFTMATQAGAGLHVNISPRFDLSTSLQYMVHFGKDIHAEVEDDIVHIEKHDYSTPDGHLLWTLSFNYKIADLW